MKECTPAELRHLLFKSQGTDLVVRQSRTSLAVWLACLSQETWALELRALLLRASPHAFFRFGDPSRLPIKFRAEVIKAFVQRFADRDVVRVELENATISRLSDPALATALNEQLLSPTVTPSLKIELLKLAIHGQVHCCVPAAIEIISENTTYLDLPSYALWLIRDLANPEQKRTLYRIVGAMREITAFQCGCVIETLFPEFIDAEGAVALIQKVTNARSLERDLSWVLLHQLKNLGVSFDAAPLFRLLLSLFQQPPLRLPHPISQRYGWLRECVAVLLKRTLSKSSLSDSETDLAARALWLVRQDCFRTESLLDEDLSEQRGGINFTSLTARHPEVRRQAFWLTVAQNESDSSMSWKGRNAYGYRLKFKENPTDFDWLVDDIANRTSVEDREIAYFTAVALLGGLGCPKEQLQKLAQVAKTLPQIRQHLVSIQRNRRFRWLLRIWYRQTNHGWLNGWWWIHRRADLRNWYASIRGRFRLHASIKRLESGEAVGWLGKLVSTIYQSDRFAPGDWSKLEKEYGKRLAQATKQGCIAVWKRYSPPLFSEEKSYGLIAGLAGLQLLFMEGRLDFAGMSSDEARRATLYAINEINDFSDWFVQLAHERPNLVEDVLGERLACEWALLAGQESASLILSRFAYRDHPAAILVGSTLRRLIETGDSANPRVLRLALRFLINKNTFVLPEWAALASQRVILYQPESEAFLDWLVIWLQTDSDRAMDFLGTLLPPPNQSDPLSNLVVRICAALSSLHANTPLLIDGSELPLRCSERFIRLVYLYVSPGQDINRADGGGYSPIARDDAQYLRWNLLTSLSEHPSAAAQQALENLLNASELSSMRGVILHLLDTRAERFADEAPWDEVEVRDFARNYESVPKTLEDLFHVALRRLEAIKYDVEQAEESLRYSVRPDDNESRLQSFLVTELRRRNNGRYTAPKEAEIDGGQRPDIQIQRPEIPGHVQIELKLGDMKERTVRSLLSDVETQLAGQYLRARDATHGIFVLGFTGGGARQSWRDTETNEALSFEDVVSRLRQHAYKLAETTDGIERLEVVGIDFRPLG